MDKRKLYKTIIDLEDFDSNRKHRFGEHAGDYLHGYVVKGSKFVGRAKFTRHEIERAMERGRKSPEDFPKPGGLLDFIVKAFK
jgi:hypothetical protein